MAPRADSWNDLSGIFGLTPAIPLPDLRPVAALVIEWQWSRSLPSILSFGGWTIDQVATDPRVAAQVRVLWKILKASRRQSLERERKNLLREQLVWRQEGLPVGCPLCGAPRSCNCRVDPLRALQEGKGLGRRGGVRGVPGRSFSERRRRAS